MNKEEILARSRKENDGSDERTQYIGLKAANFSLTVLIALWVVLSRFTPLDDKARYAIGLLVNTTCFSNFAYQLTQNRRKTVIIFSILFLLAAIFYLVLFLKFSLNLF